MAKDDITDTSVTHVGKGMFTDVSPENQPKDTYRFALNAVDETTEGDQGNISNEKGAVDISQLPEGYLPIGDKYVGSGATVIISVNPVTEREEIGLFNEKRDDKYQTIVNTTVLEESIIHQCEIIFRLRRGSERVIYWVNGKNNAKTFNFDRVQNFYTAAYSEYIRNGGDPTIYQFERWDSTSFDLYKRYRSIPFFSNVQIIETGNIYPGSYNAVIQYVDGDLNPTEWINSSNTINIYNDTSTNPYEKIRGSRNIQTDSQSFPRASKSIKFTITNLDTNFPYYRIAIVQANNNSGIAHKAIASDLIPTTDSTYTYTGNDENLSEVSLEDILIDQEVIFAPQHIKQLENRLLLLNTKGKDINWCDFQAYASRITADLATKEVILNNISSEPNVKNVKSTFLYGGYLPGEVYAFNVHYVFSDYISPGFHIPGKNPSNQLSRMQVYECESRYINIHNCSTGNYWGTDTISEQLIGRKIRHHRFPFRKDVNKPLFTRQSSNININKYKLTAIITLAPGKTYPVSGSSPAVISYIFNYQIDGAANADAYNGILTSSDVSKTITIYDNTLPLEQIAPPEYGLLDPASSLAVNYMPPGNETFAIDFNYETYVASSSINNDTSEIFGIEFSNIERPHPDCIGVIITRAERTEDDKMIIDNGVFGLMTQYEQYRSFGLIMPKQYYTFTGYRNPVQPNVSITPPKTLEYYKKALWFFNPEYQYFQKKTEFDHVVTEGFYTEDIIQMPSISNQENIRYNIGGTRGVYIDDVQAGTSYNPELHKKKNADDDGFDLIIGYRNTTITYASNTVFDVSDKNRIFYLNAAAYQNLGGETFYNVSVDNKIGIYTFDTEINIDNFYNPVTKKNGLMYGAMIRDGVNLYSNFMTRPFYKEHNNPIMFGDRSVIDKVQIFNGDAKISAMTFVSSVFSDMVVANRQKKSKVWKIIAGAILIVAGVVLTVLGGAGVIAVGTGVSLLLGLAVSYGVSLAISGIKFEQFKRMIDVDYEKGLKETVSDGGTYETIRDTLQGKSADDASYDDTIRWFSDRVSNIYIESSVPFGLRSGLTAGVTDFIDSPTSEFDEEGFRTYLTEKLTVVDRDQGSGRLYKGYATAEVYDMNKDYLRINKQKLFTHLPLEYDCCSDNTEAFPMRVWWSEQSFQEEKTDNYRVFLPNNYRDIEGEHGEITGAYTLGNALYIHTREGLWHLPQSLQERVTNEIVSFIGTGSFFSIPPRKVADDELGTGGSQHKWGTIKTRNGVVFVNEIENKIYLHSDKLRDISLNGLGNEFKNKLKSFLSKQFYDILGIKYSYDNNPANPSGVGYLVTYDSRHKRIIFTKKDYKYLGDFSKIIKDFDPGQDYIAGQIFIDEKGFNEILGVTYQNQVTIDQLGWQESNSVLSRPVLPGIYTESAPLALIKGTAYMKNGQIIYRADIGTSGTEEIPINMRSCENDIIIVNIQ